MDKSFFNVPWGCILEPFHFGCKFHQLHEKTGPASAVQAGGPGNTIDVLRSRPECGQLAPQGSMSPNSANLQTY
jgi:hypothetical protein